MRDVTVAIIGAGQRGNDTYGFLMLDEIKNVKVVGVADIIKQRRDEVAKKHQIDESFVFNSYEELLAHDKFCDAVLVCTSDDLHYEPAKMALEKGYHLLLEKPMINKEEDVSKLEKLIHDYPHQVFMVCHVLRYTPFFMKLKQLIETKEIGDVVNIQHNENIGYYHFAHSFVRGNWRNTKESSPLILAKSCHDLDILNFLVDSTCQSVASYGDLNLFKSSKKPVGASSRCINCQVESTCPYSANKLYFDHIGHWPTTVITSEQTKEGVLKALEEGPYGRCVYDCDNDVVDHQVTILEYENGVSMTFNLCAFTHDISRSIKIMGTHGEIRAHMEKNEIEIHLFGQSDVRRIKALEEMSGHVGHGGGDGRLLLDFIELVRVAKEGMRTSAKSSAANALQSHKMAFAAEKSRLTHQCIAIDESSN